MTLPDASQNAAKISAGLASSLYTACPVKRQRRTNAELKALDTAIFDYSEKYAPVTVRQLFYAMTILEGVGKDENGYDLVQRETLKLRRNGVIPWDWVSDNTRWMFKSPSHSSIEAALMETVRTYRRKVWTSIPVHVELWVEKDALAGVLGGVTDPYDVPLYPARGFSSDTFLVSTAGQLSRYKKPCFVYYFGDHDPSGVAISRQIEDGLRRYAPGADIHFERVGVNPEQIEAWGLPTRPTKKTDSRAKNFEGESCELDSLGPDLLRQLARECIERHINPQELERLRATEEDERRTWLAAFGELA